MGGEWSEQMKPWQDVALMAGAQFISYVNLTINFRAIAHAQYAAAGLSAGTAAFLAYLMVRRVSHAESHWGLLGMVVGGAIADMVGIWLTRSWG